MTVMVKITKLTGSNVDALRELPTEDEATRVTLGATFATFDMEQHEALRLVEELQRRAAKATGIHQGNYKSLFAVIRKIKAQAEVARNG